MPRLSSSIADLRPHYTVVVVGSGYGGAIAAARLARAGQQVCVLERGKEWTSGSFPRGALGTLREVQARGASLPGGQAGARSALLTFHVDGDVTVLTGSGLGGTSLINANVALRPDPRLFEDARWPAGLRADVDGLLADGFERAARTLAPAPYPEAFPKPAKLSALEQTAAHLGAGPAVRPPLCVTFQGGVNAAGVEQRACNLCGDCVAGCNRDAKNDLRQNYLPLARRAGAELFCEVEVRHLSRDGRRWRVHYRPLGAGRERFGGPDLFVTAEHVILSAGTLGSTELLLRSRDKGLPVSGMLGRRFSGNGDLLAFGDDLTTPVEAVGHGDGADGASVGPCITGLVDGRGTERVEDGVVVQEGVVPGTLAPLMPAVLGLSAARSGRDGVARRWLRGAARALEAAAAGAGGGAAGGVMRHTQTLLVMSHDDGEGVLRLEGDALRADWASAGHHGALAATRERLAEAARRQGGAFVTDPLWAFKDGHGMVTVHPLGGCAMAEDAERGVVDHEGRVFAGTSGAEVHPGLYVCDGAVIPRPLGVNPLLTISALAERFCVRLARREGWALEGAPAAALALPVLPTPPGPRAAAVSFTETMHGHVSAAVHLPAAEAGDARRRGASPLRLVVTAVVEDGAEGAEGAGAGPGRTARLHGTVSAPALSHRPLVVHGGTLRLFAPDRAGSGLRTLRYRLPLRSEEGAHFLLEGVKVLREGVGLHLWTDTTTLHVALWRGAQEAGAPALRGVLRLGVADLARQLATLRAPGARGAAEEARAVGRFVRHFASSLLEVGLPSLAPLPGRSNR
jgi:cholesterol oxidase